MFDQRLQRRFQDQYPAESLLPLELTVEGKTVETIKFNQTDYGVKRTAAMSNAPHPRPAGSRLKGVDRAWQTRN